nr:MAG TPA: hypothetical protein [Caudoviricetes sp.]
MDEKDKEFEQAIREKIEAICKQQFTLGMLAGNRAAMEIMWQQSKDMTSAKKIKKLIKDKLDTANKAVDMKAQEVNDEA